MQRTIFFYIPFPLYGILTMPREHKKRGRREDRKRKREEEERVEDKEHAAPSKRQRPGCAEKDVEFVVAGDDGSALPDEYTEYAARPGDLPFYGLLDEEEQEYFKRADSMLELNQFADAEERKLFLANVYKEADGKELKIASSQSCSRLMERLILLSTPSQLKNLFQKFNGQ